MITYGNTTHFCLSVAERLKKEHNWDVEVIDIRSLIPLDTETIFASVKKTGKVLIVHEDKVFSGFGAEIAGIVGTEMFRYLDAPIQRVGSTYPCRFPSGPRKGDPARRRTDLQRSKSIIGILMKRVYQNLLVPALDAGPQKDRPYQSDFIGRF